MRTLLVMVASLLISQYGFAQQPPAGGQGGGRGGRGGADGGGRGQAAQPAAPQDPGFECFQSVPTPDFPVPALQSRIDGTVYIWIHLTAQGTIDKIDNQVASAWTDASKIWGDASKLLVPAVEKAVRASSFKPECNGKTVAVVYRYELHGDAMANPKPTTKTEANVMYIDSAPATRTAVGAANAAAKK